MAEPGDPSRSGRRPQLACWLQRRGAELAFVAIAAALVLWVAWEAFTVRLVTYGSTADYWEHSATLRALIESPLHPRNPHLVSPNGSPRFIPSFVLVATVAQALGRDALFAMGLAATLNCALLCVGIYAFFRSYFASRLAAVYGILVMFTTAREAFHFSNVYQLKVFFSVAAYPSTTALGLVLLGFAWALRLLRLERAPRWEWLAFAAYQGLVLVTHPLTAMMLVAGVPLLAITWRLAEDGWVARWRSSVEFLRSGAWRGLLRNESLLRRTALLATMPASFLLAQAWPYFSVWEVLRGGKPSQEPDWLQEAMATALKGDFGNKHAFYRWPELIDTVYLALLGVPVLIFLLVRGRHLFLVLSGVAMITPFIVNAYVPLPLGHRFLLLAIFFLQTGVVWLLLALTPGTPETPALLERSRLRWAGVPLVALFLIYSVQLNVGRALSRFESTAQRFKGQPSPVLRYCQRIQELAGDRSVVLGAPDLTWPLPTFGPKVVSLLHENPLVEDETRRSYDVRRFLNARVDDAEREEIVARYGVTHVLIKGNPSGKLADFLQAHGRRLPLPTGKTLFELKGLPLTPASAIGH